ncbi:MAG: hypothetical protein JXR68_10115, partial [Bacteroidales bacterium]|nr:hypothetical protein [Bacteroidales bacterium]
MNILISPLNWGIGHATRLVPIINTLKLKHNITIAADGKSSDFLKDEFPSLVILSAPKLNITYTKNATLLPFKILLSFPKLIFFFYQNKKFVKKISSTQKIDLIVSDNRFG